MRIQGVIAVAVVSAGLAGVIGFQAGLFLTRPSREDTAAKIAAAENFAEEKLRDSNQKYSDLEGKFQSLIIEKSRFSDTLNDRERLIEQLHNNLAVMEKNLNALKMKEKAHENKTPEPAKLRTLVYTINDDVRVGNVRWKLLSASNIGKILNRAQRVDRTFIGDSVKTIQSQGKFVKIRMEVENLGKDLLTVTSVDLIDSVGRTYIPSMELYAWIPTKEQLWLIENLNPNMPYIFTYIYEIPDDATDLNVIVGDLSLIGQEEEKISLGF